MALGAIITTKLCYFDRCGPGDWMDAGKVAKMRKRASLYIDEKAVSTKSNLILELLYFNLEMSKLWVMFIRP